MLPSWPPAAAARHSLRLLVAGLLSNALALNVLEWNPHWQCFSDGHRSCEEHAEATLSEVLKDRTIDFANVVELEDGGYALPKDFVATTQRCGQDLTTLIHDSSRWTQATTPGAESVGCMAVNDRAFVIQQFKENAAYGDRQIVVVGAHYPHGNDRTALRDALNAVVMATDVKSVVLIADTNTVGQVPDAKVMTDLHAPQGALRGTALEPSCCSNNGFQSTFDFDRIIANFGDSPMGTDLMFEKMPSWARVGELHKPILAIGKTVTSTLTTATTTRATGTLTGALTMTLDGTSTAPPPATSVVSFLTAGLALATCCVLFFYCCMHKKVLNSGPNMAMVVEAWRSLRRGEDSPAVLPSVPGEGYAREDLRSFRVEEYSPHSDG